jgi:hypothetical protein
MSCDHWTYGTDFVPRPSSTAELSSYIGETENDRKADLGREESKPHRQEAQSRIIPDSTQIDPEYVWGDEGPSND